MQFKHAAVLAALVTTVSLPAHADSISAVENARAKDRAGAYLTRQDREHLRRHGATDDGWRYAERRYGYYGYGYGYGYGPSLYVEPVPYGVVPY